MPLPPLVEVIPLEFPVQTEVTVPGSKSITNRVLLLAALANGRTALTGALWSEDTRTMVDCLQKLGFEISVQPDPEPGNRAITVIGRNGRIQSGGTLAAPLELFVGNAGTTARFLTALVCLGQGVYRLSGDGRMHERPQSALFAALRQLGYRLDSENDRLPVLVHGTGPRPGARCGIGIHESSQFASALLLAAAHGGWDISIESEGDSAPRPSEAPPEAPPYVQMTSKLIAEFNTLSKAPDSVFQIEPDASSASYFWGTAWLLGNPRIRVAGWTPQSIERSFQIDAQFPRLMGTFPHRLSRENDLGDSIMTAIVLAPFAADVKTFTGLGRLRLQECERVQALRTELTKCGARIREQADTLEIAPGPMHGADVETYNDHRMAMCFAMLGLRVPGIRVQNPACVKKTFPSFFQKLVEAPPAGLGAAIVDADGRKLTMESLDAD